MAFFIVTAMKTSNLTYFLFFPRQVTCFEILKWEIFSNGGREWSFFDYSEQTVGQMNFGKYMYRFHRMN
jgi:hypothetical protein